MTEIEIDVSKAVNTDINQENKKISQELNSENNAKAEIKSLQNQLYDFNKNNHWAKLIQLGIINFILIAVLIISYLLGKEFIKLAEKNHYAVFALSFFATASVLSLYFICGSAIRAMFNDHSDNKGHSSFVKDYTDTTE